MGTQPDSDKPSDSERNDALRYAIGHSDHLHITLDNLADLANIRMPTASGEGGGPVGDPDPADRAELEGDEAAVGPARTTGEVPAVPYGRLLETWAPPVGSPPVVWPDPRSDAPPNGDVVDDPPSSSNGGSSPTALDLDLDLDADTAHSPPSLPQVTPPTPAATAGGAIWTAPAAAVTTGSTKALTDTSPPPAETLPARPAPPTPAPPPEPPSPPSPPFERPTPPPEPQARPGPPEPQTRPGPPEPPARPAPAPPRERRSEPEETRPATGPLPVLGPIAARTRSGWARPAERWLLEALALGAASVAFLAPSAWLLTVLAVCIVGGVMAFVASGHSLLILPRRALYRSVTLLHPRSSIWFPVLIARVVILAILLPAAVASVAWLANEGTTGLVVAARAGAWTHGFRVGVVIVCLMLLTSVGDGRYQRSGAARRWATDISDGALVAFTLACAGFAVVVIGFVPHPADDWAARADGLGWLPAAARPRVDEVRDDIVTAELDTVASCLSSRSDTGWHTSYTAGNALDEPDIARLQAAAPDDEVPAGVPSDLATAIVATHNQLAPWVEAIEVGWGDDSTAGAVVRIDRAGLPRNPPLTDASLLPAAAVGGGEWLEGAAVDDAVALRCSASSPATIL